MIKKIEILDKKRLCQGERQSISRKIANEIFDGKIEKLKIEIEDLLKKHVYPLMLDETMLSEKLIEFYKRIDVIKFRKSISVFSCVPGRDAEKSDTILQQKIEVDFPVPQDSNRWNADSVLSVNLFDDKSKEPPSIVKNLLIITPNKRIRKMISTRIYKKASLEYEKDALKQEAQQVLNSCTTINKAIEKLPSLKKVIHILPIVDVVKPKKKVSKELVPIDMIKKINDLLGKVQNDIHNRYSN